jgi:hypothetical protein
MISYKQAETLIWISYKKETTKNYENHQRSLKSFFDPIFFLLIRKSIGGFYSNIITGITLKNNW